MLESSEFAGTEALRAAAEGESPVAVAPFADGWGGGVVGREVSISSSVERLGCDSSYEKE